MLRLVVLLEAARRWWWLLLLLLLLLRWLMVLVVLVEMMVKACGRGHVLGLKLNQVHLLMVLVVLMTADLALMILLLAYNLKRRLISVHYCLTYFTLPRLTLRALVRPPPFLRQSNGQFISSILVRSTFAYNLDILSPIQINPILFFYQQCSAT